MFSKRKRRQSARRNLLLVALLVLFFGALAVGVRLVKLEPVLILPEGREEIAARRKSPDNAALALFEAFALLPKNAPKGPLLIDDPARPGQQRIYEAEMDSMSRFLGFERPDDHPEVLDYLRACEPATAKAREALQKPFFLLPEPPGLFIRYWGSHSFGAAITLEKLLVVQGNAAWRFENDLPKGIGCITDALRLVNLTAQDAPGRGGWSDECLDMAYRILREMAAENPTAERLALLQTSLAAVGPPYLNRNALLEASWRMIDDTQLNPVPERESRFPESVMTRFFLWRLRGLAASIRDTKDLWYEQVRATPAAYNKWKMQRPEFQQRRKQMFWYGPLQEVDRIVQYVSSAQKEYYGTLLAIALERYRAARGAFPETLAALSPEYLPDVPKDPLTGEAIGYRKQEERYLLYSIGMNLRDDEGRPDDRLLFESASR